MMRVFTTVTLFLFSVQGICDAAEVYTRVYLATYPRSGNHWMRHLIEEATHIATSSVYRDVDYFHLEKPFPWLGFSTNYGYAGNCRYPLPGETVVIKTHYPARTRDTFDLPSTAPVIHIVRHPVHSFVSEYLYYHPNSGNAKIPRNELIAMINAWKLFEEHWEKQPNVVTIRYEDMFLHLEYFLRLALSVTGYSYSDEDIARAIKTHAPKGNPYKAVKNFTNDDLVLIRHSLRDLMTKYGYK